MEAIRTLLDRQEPGSALLPPELCQLYGGDLRFPPHGRERPYVVGNFVSTVDGVVSFEVPGKSGGGEISGYDDADRFLMGLLRASADAVIVGATTMRDAGAKHVWLAEHIYPPARELFLHYRRDVLGKAGAPLNIVVSGSGSVDLARAMFHTPGVRSLILTTDLGAAFLAGNDIPSSTQVRAVESAGTWIDAHAILHLLKTEFGIRLLLHEGGPLLFGAFAGAGCVDELFLTLAPQWAGRNSTGRPGVISGIEWFPGGSPQLDLCSVKHRGEHLYLRYRTRAR